MIEKFEVKLFKNSVSKRNNQITTKNISVWLGCSVRFIQDWGKKNKVKIEIINGRRQYIWDDKSLKKLENWFKDDKNFRDYINENKTNKFVLDIFKKYVKHHKLSINTKVVSEYTKRSVRVLQKWCKKNNVDFHRIKGIKHYIWDDNTLRKLEEWIIQKSIKKPKKRYYIPKPKVKKKPVFSRKEELKKIIRFYTLNDFFENNRINNKLMKRTLKYWCKSHNVPFEIYKGRKYYKINKKVEKELVIIYQKKHTRYFK